MRHAATGIFAAPTAPRAGAQGVVLPDGSRVALAGGRIDGRWECANRYGQARLVHSFDPILGKDTFSAEQEGKALESLRTRDDDQEIARYGGFIVERLYLSGGPVAAERAEIGARVARLLIRFWEEPLAAGDARVAFTLPMLWRSYWRALVPLVRAADDLLPPGRTPDATVLRALAEQLSIDPSTLYLSGWVEQLPVLYRRALAEWRAVCLDDLAAPFFMEQLCAWEGLPTGGWQALREREVRATVWEDRSLRPPGVVTYEARGELRRLIDVWYRPRYDLWTAARLRWLVGRAEGEGVVSLSAHCFVLGAVRLWAGAAVAYIATMLQGDTWRTLIALSIVQARHGYLITVGLVGLTSLYLAYEVARRSGVATLLRVGFIMLKGEIGALAIGALVMWLLAPSVLGQEFPTDGRLLAVILYAQLALFIGVFTLLFEEKLVTAPLAAP